MRSLTSTRDAYWQGSWRLSGYICLFTLQTWGADGPIELVAESWQAVATTWEVASGDWTHYRPTPQPAIQLRTRRKVEALLEPRLVNLLHQRRIRRRAERSRSSSMRLRSSLSAVFYSLLVNETSWPPSGLSLDSHVGKLLLRESGGMLKSYQSFDGHNPIARGNIRSTPLGV